MTLLTWQEGPQMIGFAMVHLMPGFLVFGTLFMIAASLWFIVVGAAAVLRRRRMGGAEWVLMAATGFCLVVLVVPYPVWQWGTVCILGVPPLPRAANEMLCDAAADGDVRTAGSLLSRGLDANSFDLSGHLPLYEASEKGQAGMVRFLLQHGARVNEQGAGGRTALHGAALGGHADVVKLLLAAGADRNIRTRENGVTAADLAWSASHTDVVELLEGAQR